MTRAGDGRASIAALAAVFSAVLSVGQLLVAHLLGLLYSRGAEETAGAALVVWIAATAVGLGAAVLRLRAASAWSRTQRAVAIGGAGFGALLAVPVGAAVAALAQMYGGQLAQPRVAWLGVLGVAVGLGAGWAALTRRELAWSLVGWSGLLWLLLLAASLFGVGSAPVPGQVDLLPSGGPDAHTAQQAATLALPALCLGAVLRRRVDLGRGRAWIAAAGALPLFAAFLTAAAVAGQTGWRPAAVLLCGAGGAALGALLPRGAFGRFIRRRDGRR